MAVRYGCFDHDTPAAFSGTEAYLFSGVGKWKPLNMADVLMKTGVLSEAEFNKRWPLLPPLPPHAFTSQ